MTELLALTANDFRRDLSQRCERYASQSEAARAMGVAVSEISETLSGKRDASARIICALGYVPVVRYIRGKEQENV